MINKIDPFGFSPEKNKSIEDDLIMGKDESIVKKIESIVGEQDGDILISEGGSI